MSLHQGAAAVKRRCNTTSWSITPHGSGFLTGPPLASFGDRFANGEPEAGLFRWIYRVHARCVLVMYPVSRGLVEAEEHSGTVHSMGEPLTWLLASVMQPLLELFERRRGPRGA